MLKKCLSLHFENDTQKMHAISRHTPPNSNYAELWVELSDLKYKGQSVPVEFYEMISRYLPPEEEEESYRGDPVENAIMHNMEYVDRVMTSLGMYLSSIRINPYARFR